MPNNKNEKKIKHNLFSTICNDWKLRRFKQNMIDISTYIGLSSIKFGCVYRFLRSPEDKVYCLGTGNGLTEVLKVSNSLTFAY